LPLFGQCPSAPGLSILGVSAEADLALMDVNNDLSIDLSDGIYTLAFLFQGGPGPAQGVNCFSIPGCPQNASCP